MIEKFDKLQERFAFAVLVVALFGMLGLTLTNIVSRWFHTSFIWVEPVVRHLVFIAAFMGAVLATGKKTHIKIDLVGRWLEGGGKPRLRKAHFIFISLFSALACFLLAKAGYDFTLVEAQYGKKVFWGLHSSYLVAIIPLGFSLIGIRFLTGIFLSEK